ncbi:MAG: type II CAAX endopeptidase family protein [Propionibacteriaceae bacterium]|nr:type II CAAX endopeptidase family protein [Propionibacteriaceae bacterium]
MSQQNAYVTALRRQGRSRWWRSLIAVVLGVLVISLVPLVVTIVSSSLGFATDTASPDYPWQLTVRNIGAFVVCLPLLILINRGLNRLPTREQVTGAPAWRWGLALRSLGVACVAVAVYAVTLFAIEGRLAFAPEPRFALIVALLVLLVPVQVFTEELLFRGMFMQGLVSAIGVTTVRVLIAVVVSSVIFAALHGTQSPAMWASRFGMALIYGYALWRSDGLEVPTALHTANNLVLLLLAAVTGTFATTFSNTSVTWVSTSLQLVALGVSCAVALRLAQRRAIKKA